MKLLILSNGHGEDVIATKIVAQLQLLAPQLELAALPIVGEGHAYRQLKIPLAGRVQQMPSGGFIYMESDRLWQDLQGGLIALTREQIKIVRQWGQSGGVILAVGDIVPLFYAWLSKANYAFVGTAKSEYYLRDEQGWLPQTSKLERYFGSVYLPWECWLASRQRCQAIFPRDSLTAKILQQQMLNAYDLGNPMMDDLLGKSPQIKPKSTEKLSILLLPGSRMPEALRNWQQIILAVENVINSFPEQQLEFLAAIAPALDLSAFSPSTLAQGWNSMPSIEGITFIKERASLTLNNNTYVEYLQRADLAIAMAGTATEQFVGLGKPVITMAGEGPQFTSAFAEAQTRLLGCSVILVDNPQQVGKAIAEVMNAPQQLQKIALNGKRRMGEPGAARRIALCLQKTLLSYSSTS